MRAFLLRVLAVLAIVLVVGLLIGLTDKAIAVTEAHHPRITVMGQWPCGAEDSNMLLGHGYLGHGRWATWRCHNLSDYQQAAWQKGRIAGWNQDCDTMYEYAGRHPAHRTAIIHAALYLGCD